jgi:DNA-binding NarL/FixJ family response regulator
MSSAPTLVGPVRISPRELEVLSGVSEGMSSADVANLLCISKRTVDFHLANVYRKLGVTNRMAAHRAAIAHGLIPFERIGRAHVLRREDFTLH